MKCRGMLFDLDGTLVDSLAVVERAWCRWADRFAIPHDELLSFIHGKPAITSLRHFMPGQPEEAVQAEFKQLERLEAEDTEGITALPGALALLRRLDELGVPWGIVTSGSVPVASARCQAAGIPKPKVFVTVEQVSCGKPYPEPYLLGAERLGLPVEDCLVVEDAEAGIESGLAAGCRVAAVNAPAQASGLDKVDLRLHSLNELLLTPEPDGGVRVIQSV